MSAKLQEAQEHCKAAEKYLKTSLLRWKPDYDSAADEYSQAAQCYRIVRDVNNCKECHLKASEYYKKNGSLFHAAKALENIILVCKEAAAPEQLFEWGLDAGSLYQQHGSPDSAASVLDKTARLIESRAPELAVKLYNQATDASTSGGSDHQACEFLAKASRLLVRMKRYDEAADSLRREIQHQEEAGNTGAVGRLVVAVVLVQLARGDVVAAEKAYKEWGNSCEAAECSTLENLLSAYDEEDRAAAQRALHAPFIRSMDVEYSRLAMTVPLPPEEMVVPPRAAESSQQDLHVVSTAADVEESPYESSNSRQDAPAQDDEEELC